MSIGRQRWTPRQLRILRREYPHRTAGEVARMVRHPIESVYRRANRLGLKKSAAFLTSPASGRLRPGDLRGLNGRFFPGQQPWNKGLKGWTAPGRSAETRFRKGNRPQTWLPVGSYRVNTDGLLDRKVSDTGYPPRDWVGVHRLVWVDAHGPIPRGHVVVFRPGRKTTHAAKITEDALELVTRPELMRRNSYHTRYPKEIGFAIQLRGALMRQINERERHAKQD